MAENIIKMTNMKRNDVIYVSNSNAGQFSKIAEACSKKAEQFALDCNNILKLVQRIYDDCTNMRNELEVSFENTLSRIEEEFAQDISQEVSDINQTVNYLKTILVDISYQYFESEQWSKNDDNDLYSLTLDTPVIFGIYDENKNKIFNIDTRSQEDNTIKLSALNPFNGYVCVTSIDTSAYNPGGSDYTEEELDELSIEDWDLI